MPSIDTTLLALLLTTLLGFLQWRSAARVQHAEASEKTSKVHVNEADRAERIGNSYDRLVENLEERVEKLDKRVTWLEEENRKMTNAYGKAIIFIRERIPGEIPNFLDTDPKIGKR